MCKIKQYTQEIRNCALNLVIRLDYFCKPDSVNELLNRIEKFIKERTYSQRRLTEEEMQIVDVNSVAEILGLSINEIISIPCHLFRGLFLTDIKCNAYIHKNFLALAFSPISDEDNFFEILKDLLSEIDDKLISIYSVWCTTQHACTDIPKNKLWEFADHTAFPVMEGNEIINGIYKDRSTRDKIEIELIREVTPSNGKNEQYDITVQTTALFPANNVEALEGGAIIRQMYDNSLQEVTRCFK